jgi:hypothetical protein
VPRSYARVLGVSRVLLRIARAFNLFGGLILVVAFPASFVFEPLFGEFFSKQPPRIDAAWLVPSLRLWIVLAIPMVAAAHVLFSRLLDVVETVRVGDPFVPENAARMKTVAWCALAVQLLDLTFGVMAATMNAAGSNVEWRFSAKGWLGVALLFVLARVFEQGTRIRADLEAVI